MTQVSVSSSNPVQIGSEVEWIPVEACGIPALLIGKKENEIGACNKGRVHEGSVDVEVWVGKVGKAIL